MLRWILPLFLSYTALARTPGVVHESKLVDLMAPARGQEEAHRVAEYRRLSERLHRLAKKNNLNGMRRIYLLLEVLELPLSYADLLVGAQIHRANGDVAASYACLKEAARLQGTREVIDWLVAIDRQYGRVALRLGQGLPGGLDVERPPSLPDEKAAIALARKRIQESGGFEGFLPEGIYSLAGQRFEVRTGPHTLELRLRPRD
jgi:hypothetical protein